MRSDHWRIRRLKRRSLEGLSQKERPLEDLRREERSLEDPSFEATISGGPVPEGAATEGSALLISPSILCVLLLRRVMGRSAAEHSRLPPFITTFESSA